MRLNRRNFFQITAVSVTAFFGGCVALESTEPESRSDSETTTQDSNIEFTTSEESVLEMTTEEKESKPSLEVLELIQSESQLVSVDNPDDSSFTATIQNTGHSGNIAVALFWQTEESGEKPKSVDSLGVEAYDIEREKELYFNADERRTIEFTAKPPENAIGYYFFTQPATYGANIRNTGGDGRTTVIMDFKDTLLGSDVAEQKTVYIGQSVTKEVLFNVTIRPETEWEIQANPAE